MKKKTSSAPASTGEAQRRSMITRLRRIEGQLRGIQGMIAEDASCESVVQQVAAARRALDRAFYEILACSMEAGLESAADVEAARSAGTHVARLLAKYG